MADINEIRSRLGISDQPKMTPQDVERQNMLNKIQTYKTERDQQIKRNAKAKVDSRSFVQKAVDVALPGAQFREGKGAMQTIKEVGIGAAKGLGSTITGASTLGEQAVRGIGRAVTPKKYESMFGFDKSPTAGEQIKATGILDPKTSEERTGFAIEQIAEFLLPASKITKAGKVAEGAAAGSKLLKSGSLASKVAPTLAKAGTESGIVALQQAVQQGKIDEDTLRTGLYAAAFPIAGKGIQQLKNVINTDKTASRIINSLIKPLSKDFAYGKNPGLAVAKEGIVANSLDDLGQKVMDRKNQIWQQTDDILANAKGSVSTKTLTSGLDDAIAEAERFADVRPGIYNRLQGAKTALEKEIGGRTTLTAQEANKLKQFIGDLTTWTGSATEDSIYNKAVRNVYGSIKEGIEKVSPGVKELNERWGNLKSASDAIQHRGNILNRQNLIGYAQGQAGLTGGIIGGVATPGDFETKLKGAATGALAGFGARALGSTAVKTRAAALLAKGKPQLGKLTQQAISGTKGTTANAGSLTERAIESAKNAPKYVPPKISIVKKISREAGNIGSEIISKGKQMTGGSWLRNFGVITGYGSPYWEAGLDVDAKKGDPVPAPFGGKVSGIVPAEKSGGFGNQVRIQDAKGNELWISHLDKIGKIKPGQKLAAGTLIGTAGNSGNVIAGAGNDGTHLDLTIKKPGGGYMTAKEVEKYLKSLG